MFKLFDTAIISLKEFLKKKNIVKTESADDTKHAKLWLIVKQDGNYFRDGSQIVQRNPERHHF